MQLHYIPEFNFLLTLPSYGISWKKKLFFNILTQIIFQLPNNKFLNVFTHIQPNNLLKGLMTK